MFKFKIPGEKRSPKISAQSWPEVNDSWIKFVITCAKVSVNCGEIRNRQKDLHYSSNFHKNWRIQVEMEEKLSWKLILENIDYIIIELEIIKQFSEANWTRFGIKIWKQKWNNCDLFPEAIISNNGL